MPWIPTEWEKRAAWDDPGEYNSIDWETMFPDHCYICHIASETYDEDPHRCGPHCERQG